MNQLNLLPEVLASLALLFGTVCIGGLSIYPPSLSENYIFRHDFSPFPSSVTLKTE